MLLNSDTYGTVAVMNTKIVYLAKKDTLSIVAFPPAKGWISAFM